MGPDKEILALLTSVNHSYTFPSDSSFSHGPPHCHPAQLTQSGALASPARFLWWEPSECAMAFTDPERQVSSVPSAL
jgi:hypothetical protein